MDDSSGSPRINELDTPSIVPTIMPIPSGFCRVRVNRDGEEFCCANCVSTAEIGSSPSIVI
jgi:hypothetical protein